MQSRNTLLFGHGLTPEITALLLWPMLAVIIVGTQLGVQWPAIFPRNHRN